MLFKDYLDFISARIKEAEDKNDVEECIRLAKVLIDVTIEKYIQNLERNKKK